MSPQLETVQKQHGETLDAQSQRCEKLEQLQNVSQLEKNEQAVADCHRQIGHLQEQIQSLRSDLLKEQSLRKAEDSWYAQTKKELEKTRRQNEEMWQTMRGIQKDHEFLLSAVNGEVDLLRQLQDRMETL